MLEWCKIFQLCYLIGQLDIKKDKKMKTRKVSLIMAGMGLMVSVLSMQSCDDGDNYNYDITRPNALVTVKPNADNSSFYMQLDDSTRLEATNLKKSPFGSKEVRALVNYCIEGKRELDIKETSKYTQKVSINWIDSILTKPTAQNYNEEQNVKQYGDDAVEIVDDWVTIAEDGYLTLRFRTRWGHGATHRVNLVHRTDVNNPYTLTFYHDAKGDTQGTIGDALVAFRLSDLADTDGKTVDLTLEWKSYSGKKTATFKYCTHKPFNLMTSQMSSRADIQGSIE